MGAVLAVGMLVTAFVRPEPMLAASASCYGPCPTTTSMTLSTSMVTYGHENLLKIYVSAKSSTPGTGIPPGYVEVTSGKYLCRARLYNGTGSCSPPARALGPGKLYRLKATYTGSTAFLPSSWGYGYLCVK